MPSSPDSRTSYWWLCPYSRDARLPRLETSIQNVIQSHDGLRLRLRAQDGEPQQYVADTPSLQPLPRYDFSSYANPQTAYERWVKAEAAKRFELFDSPLYHIATFKVGSRIMVFS